MPAPEPLGDLELKPSPSRNSSRLRVGVADDTDRDDRRDRHPERERSRDYETQTARREAPSRRDDAPTTIDPPMPPRDEKGRFIKVANQKPAKPNFGAQSADEQPSNAQRAKRSERERQSEYSREAQPSREKMSSRRNTRAEYDERAYDDNYERDYDQAPADSYDDDEDDALFGANEPQAVRRGREQADGPVEKGWRQGKQFIVEDDDEDERPFFGRFSTKKNKSAKSSKFEASRDSLRFEEPEDEREQNVARDSDEHDYDDRDRDDDRDYDDHEDGAPGVIVDADWEIVGDDGRGEDQAGDRGRDFGRRQRETRRRATAIARVEDVAPLRSAVFDEEFFASLQVTPRELEKAVRKARRRAEAREKNRMTPMRAFGWSAWAAAVAGTIYVAVAYRDEVVKIAPAAADAYAVIGIDTNSFGLAIENVRHRLAMSTGGPIIEISGSLKNVDTDAVDAPLLQAEALGPGGELLARWTFAPSSAKVDQGAAVEFLTRAPAPDGVSEVALSFAPAADVVKDLLPGG